MLGPAAKMMSWECCWIDRMSLDGFGDPVYRLPGFVSTASAAESFRSRCGSVRGEPVFPQKQIIFAQGDSADAVFYIQQGKIKLTVLSTIGKEATLGIFGGSFSEKAAWPDKLYEWGLQPQ